MTTSSVDFSQIKELLGDDWLSSSIELEDLVRFRRQFKEFFKSIGTAKTESLKEQAIVNAIQDLMKDTIVKNGGYLDSNQGKNYDMVVRSTDKNIVTLIECKRVRASELSTNSNLNKKSLQQLIYYFLKENMDSHHAFRQSLYLGRVMISDGFTWLVWNAEQFYQLVTEKFDYDGGRQVKLNKIYDKIVKSQDNYPVIKQYIEQNEREKKFQETCYMLDLHNLSIEDLSAEEWEILYHFFSGAFWLDRDAYFDPNTLHDGFYKELLHIMGLQEVAKDGLKVIIPNPSITNSMYDAIHSRLDEKVSTVMNEYVFELMILWVNRILFLKLFEAHIINVRADKKSSNHRGSYEFMSFNPEQITSWNDLNDLFFHVLSKEKQERGTLKKKCFEHVPYLNSALFMKRDIKDENNEVVLSDEISSLDSEALVVLYKDTVLSREGESLPLLEYLLKFLKAYDFSSDGQAKRRQGSKKIEDKLINASVLGKVFEKLNGYKDGSFYTPSFITAYLCKESIQQALVARVNEQLNEEFSNYQELKEEFEDWKKSSPKAVKVKEIITNFTILDPAVGSGHFLVSALNEMIQIRYDFKMIKELKDDFTLTILNDEVMIYNAHNYKPEWYTVYDLQTQVFQQELFRTKQEIIEKNLFGVDINPSSVEICRLRLWIELLKSSYYIVEGSDEEKGEIGEKLRETLDYVPMATLPNIDINIKAGNSLLYSINLQDSQDEENLLSANLPDVSKRYADLYDKYIEARGSKERKRLEAALKAMTHEELPALFGMKVGQQPKDVEWRYLFPKSLDKESAKFVGFDAVVANPPYVYNRDIDKELMKAYERQYGFKNDLYTYFYMLSFALCKPKGMVGLVTSNTFLTIESKLILRKFLQEKKLLTIYLIDNPFENAVVEPAIVLASNENDTEYELNYIDHRRKDQDDGKEVLRVSIDIFKEAPSQVFFTPNAFNLQVYHKFNSQTVNLLTKYWSTISTSKNISKNAKILDEYRGSLQVGDVSILGLLTEGGQGLATANNGYFVGVKSGTNMAKRVFTQRLEKIKKFNKEYKTTYSLDDLNEKEIRGLFTRLKEEYGRDIFGQGFLYQIVDEAEIADVESLSDQEKSEGITHGKSFVPYDKGDKDGNRWYAPTVYYINWSKANVDFLRQNSGKKGKGMPVVRNPQFYFKEGFSWNNVLNPNSINIKARLKDKTINDVASMTLYNLSEKISSKYILVLLNSYFIFRYLRSFINDSVNIQINDIRQLPIIIPSALQLSEAERLLDEAVKIKKQEFTGLISKEQSKKELFDIESKVDSFVYDLYGLTVEEDTTLS